MTTQQDMQTFLEEQGWLVFSLPNKMEDNFAIHPFDQIQLGVKYKMEEAYFLSILDHKLIDLEAEMPEEMQIRYEMFCAVQDDNKKLYTLKKMYKEKSKWIQGLKLMPKMPLWSRKQEAPK